MSELRFRIARAVAFVFTLLGVVLVLFAASTGWRALNVLTRWPETEAVVVRAGEPEGDAGRDILFRYTVRGTTYTCPVRYRPIRGEEEGAAPYAPGTRHPVRYDPADPAIIRFDVGLSLHFLILPLTLGILGAGFLGAGAVGRRLIRRSPRA